MNHNTLTACVCLAAVSLQADVVYYACCSSQLDIPHCLTGPVALPIGLQPEYPRNCKLGLVEPIHEDCDPTWDLPDPRLCRRGGDIDLVETWCNGDAPDGMCVEVFDWDGDGDVDLRDVAAAEVWFSQQGGGT